MILTTEDELLSIDTLMKMLSTAEKIESRKILIDTTNLSNLVIICCFSLLFFLIILGDVIATKLFR